MEISIENVTPAKAAKWLNKNPCNRHLREGVVEAYTADMKAGAWTECLAPIAFYEDGEIADGQHRLYAIIESDTSHQFAIWRNVPRSAGLNVDTGLNRTLVDNARISGTDKELSNDLVSVARAIEVGGRGSLRESNSTKLAYVNKHREAAKWAVHYGSRGKGLRNSIILGALGRAYYYEADKDKLARFAVVLSTGFGEGQHESAAIALRNYMQSQTRGTMHSLSLWRETFLKVQNAINYFMRGKSLTIIKGIKEEPYPLHKQQKKAVKTNGGTNASAKHRGHAARPA